VPAPNRNTHPGRNGQDDGREICAGVATIRQAARLSGCVDLVGSDDRRVQVDFR
jgi:hypothetical protein